LDAIDEAYVLQASRLAGIELTVEQLPRVVEHLRRTAALAALLEDFPLPVNEEIAPTWRP
jgi:Protein of unknown function (DUF4089)